MAVDNAYIAAIFDQIADLLEIEGANPFRIRAYRNAGRTIQTLGRDLKTLVAEGEDLSRLPDIGKDLAAKVEEIVASGRCQALEKLRERIPAALATLLKIPGLGPKRVHTLYVGLQLEDVEQLHQAAQAGKIRDLPGLGKKTEQQILQALESRRRKKHRFDWALAHDHARPLVEYLKATPGVKKIEIAGSYRRRRPTVGDLDILVTARADTPVMDRFTRYDEVKDIVSKGDTRASVILKCGLQVDLRVVDQTSFGAALQYFTGSKAHNIALRRLGQQRGLKINEYGVFKNGKRIAGRTEASVYRSVGLAYIPPESRENRGEIEAARLAVSDDS